MRTSSLEDLAPVIGYRATRIIAVWFQGQKLHVPAKADPGHPLATLIGHSALVQLVREFCSETVCVPTGEDENRYRRDRGIAEAFARGEDAPTIAARLALDVRRVQQIRHELIAIGWLKYAQGFDTAKAAGRRTAAAEALVQAPEFLAVSACACT